MVELILLGVKNSKENPKRLTDSYLMALFTLPYLYDFIVGIVCFYLMMKIAENNSKIKSGEIDLDLNDLENQKENLNENEDEEIQKLNNEEELRNEIIRRQEQSEYFEIFF